MQPPRILLLAVLATVGCSGTARPPEDEVDRFIISAMDEQKLPAVSILVLKDGRVLKHRAYGKARLDPSVSAETSTVFPIYSITKTFTSVGVLRLVDQGKLALDDPIVKFLPDIQPSWQAITVRQLLSHTSGLPDLLDPLTGLYVSEDREEALRKAANRPMIAKPGEECAYIQTGYVLLGKIVEQVTGKPFTRYMTEDVFGPLGMSSVAYGNRRSIVRNRPAQYQRVKFEWVNGTWRTAEELDTPIPDDGLDNPPYQDVGATLNVSTDDLVKWEAALVSGKLLTPESLSAMWTPAPASMRVYGTRTLGMGLGWRVADSSGHRTASFNGGVATLYLRYLDDGLTIVVLTNCQGAKTEAMAGRILSHYFPDLARHSAFTVQ